VPPLLGRFSARSNVLSALMLPKAVPLPPFTFESSMKPPAPVLGGKDRVSADWSSHVIFGPGSAVPMICRSMCSSAFEDEVEASVFPSFS
jgi:hypothetical protein